MFLRKVVLKICSKFTGRHPCWSVISIKLQSNFIEIAFRYGCYPANLLHIFRTPSPRNLSGGLFLSILHHIDNHIQNRCSKKSRKLHGKIPLMESLFNKAAGLRSVILLKRHFSTGVSLWILKNFQEHPFYITPFFWTTA